MSNPSFDLTVEKAAMILAVRAQLGQQVKAAAWYDGLQQLGQNVSQHAQQFGHNLMHAAPGSPWEYGRSALMGAGVGAGAGLLSDQEHPVSSMLQGAVLGAGAGGGINALYRGMEGATAPSPRQTKEELAEQSRQTNTTAAEENATASRGTVNAPFADAGAALQHGNNAVANIDKPLTAGTEAGKALGAAIPHDTPGQVGGAIGGGVAGMYAGNRIHRLGDPQRIMDYGAAHDIEIGSKGTIGKTMGAIEANGAKGLRQLAPVTRNAATAAAVPWRKRIGAVGLGGLAGAALGAHAEDLGRAASSYLQPLVSPLYNAATGQPGPPAKVPYLARGRQ